MEFIAFIVTVLVGFVAESLLGNWLNWPGVGAVFAAAAAAAFILRALRLSLIHISEPTRP